MFDHCFRFSFDPEINVLALTAGASSGLFGNTVMLLRATEVDEIFGGGGAHFREPPPPLGNTASEQVSESVPPELLEELDEGPSVPTDFAAPASAIENQKVSAGTKCAV